MNIDRRSEAMRIRWAEEKLVKQLNGTPISQDTLLELHDPYHLFEIEDAFEAEYGYAQRLHSQVLGGRAREVEVDYQGALPEDVESQDISTRYQ